MDDARNVVVSLATNGIEIGGQFYAGMVVIKYDPNGNLVWARGVEMDTTDAMSVGADGSIVIRGMPLGATFDGIDLGCPAMGSCSVIAGLAPDGTTTFTKTSHPFAANIAAGQGGTVVLFDGFGDCATEKISNGVYLTALSPEGTCLWSLPIEAEATGFALSMGALAPDSSGGMLAQGNFSSTVSFGDTTLSTTKGAAFLARSDEFGAPVSIWPLQVEGRMRISGTTLGDVLVAGHLGKDTDIGSGPISAGGALGGFFLGRLDAEGHPRWSRAFSGSPDAIELRAVRADGDGNAILAGVVFTPVDVGGVTLHSEGGGDVFLSRYDADGALLAARRFGDAKDQWLDKMVVNGLGTPIVTGFTKETLDFGFGPIEAPEPGAGYSYVCQVPF